MSEPCSRWIPADDKASWLAALEGIDHAFGHRPEFSEAAALVTGHEAGLWVMDSIEGRALCAIGKRSSPGGGYDVVTPLGFAGFAMQGELPSLANEWTRYWTQAGAIAGYAQLSPLAVPTRWRERLPALATNLHPAQDCLLWDLRATPDQLLAAMSSKHRQLLRKWLREDPDVTWDQEELRARFSDLYGQFLDRTAVGAVYRYSGVALERLLRAPGAFMVGVRSPQGQVEAITLFLFNGDQGESFLNAATPEGRRHSRGLYWLGALRLRELGVAVLNLGGGVSGGDALSEFKQRLGARIAATLALRQVFDPVRYGEACAVAGVEAGIVGRFPAWLGVAP